MTHWITRACHALTFSIDPFSEKKQSLFSAAATPASRRSRVPLVVLVTLQIQVTRGAGGGDSSATDDAGASSITTRSSNPSGGIDESAADTNLAIDMALAPALGPTWAHAVNTRVRTFMTRVGSVVRS